ncbi:MAG TPA: thioredoxin domain-containing protein [Bryobacteraceae bacterium]|nr:thioredoxin domain-containing protein [Bryobacteraceae bacterium]
MLCAGGLCRRATTLRKPARDGLADDFAEFQNCVDNQMSLGRVLRDLNLASANNISGTPTLFINGQRKQGIKDAAELRGLIAEAKKAAIA